MKWLTMIVLCSCLWVPMLDVSAKEVLTKKTKNTLQTLMKTKETKGISVIDAKTGKSLYSYGATQKFTPASNMKILTATTALHVLGENYRFTTTVSMTGRLKKNGTLEGDLYLIGQGDPSLQKKHLQSIAKKLKAKGIRKMTGQVYGDDSYFDKNYYAPGILQQDKAYYYGAKISALTLAPNDRYETATVYERGRRVPLKDPAQYTVNAFKDALKAQNIKGVQQQYKLKKAPATATPLIRHQSTPLANILIPFMKLSDNAIADILVKTFAQATYKQGTNSLGVLAMKQYAQQQGVDVSNWTFIDGSGMAHANKVTPKEMTRHLYATQQQRYYKAFLKSLPVAGQSKELVGGTLKNRLKQLGKAKVYAKTGTLEYGTHTLSGYVVQKDGDQLIVSVLTRGSSRSYVDQIYRALATE